MNRSGKSIYNGATRYCHFVLILVLSSCMRPLFVTHWSAADRAFIKKKGYGYPSHNKLSMIICFDKLCLNKAEWENRQKRRHFKRYKKDYDYLPGQHRPQVVASKKEEKESLEVNKVQSFKNIHFAFGKSDLDENSTGELDVLLDFLREHPDLKVRILGHTDDVGSEESNRKLSAARAKAVTDYLIAKGLDKDRINYKGFGSSKPLVEGDSEAARSKNRRVEFLLY